MVLKRLFDIKLGELDVEEILPSDIEAWKDEVGEKIHAGEQSPSTANTSLSVLKVIMSQAKIDNNLTEKAAAGIKAFPRGEHRTYTREQPNSLTPSELGEFLACMFATFSQHFAMTYMGFALGLSLPRYRGQSSTLLLVSTSTSIQIRSGSRSRLSSATG
jgi:hypothetical protein